MWHAGNRRRVSLVPVWGWGMAGGSWAAGTWRLAGRRWLCPVLRNRRSLAGRSADHAAVALRTGFDGVMAAIHGAAFLASDRPARPSMARRSRPRAPVARKRGRSPDSPASMASWPPSMARRFRLRIPLPGHPWPVVRQATRQWRFAPASMALWPPSMAQRFWLRIALPGHPWPVVRQATRQCRFAPASMASLPPSMARRFRLRIALPGHPWPVVRGRARRWRASAAAHPLG